MPRAHEADVIVVGAGPAGAATARHLARAGHRVILLDRHRFPRAKPCGDCLSAAAAGLLDRLGVLAQVEAARPAYLPGWTIVSPGGFACSAGFGNDAAGRPITALSLRREHLDHVLVQGATSAGAEMLAPCHVTDLLHDAEGRVTGVRARVANGATTSVHARLVIGADGLRSTIARKLGLVRRPPRLRKLSLSAHLHGVQDLTDVGEMHLLDGACAGLAPVTAPDTDGRRVCNLTLVVDQTRHARSVARDKLAFYWHTLERFPRLAGRLDDARAAAPNVRLLASGPFDWPARDVVTDGAALVGDAAGYYDPFTGQGIFRALAGAEILASVADTALLAGDCSATRLRRYARQLHQLVRSGRALQHAIQWITARPALADLAVRRLSDSPSAASQLVSVIGDLEPARSLLSPRLALSLLFASTPPEDTP